MPLSILILDDDPEFRALLRAILDPGGHTISEYAQAAEAQAALAEAHYHLIVVDELLADGDGLEFCRWLRSWNDEAGLIFFSSFWRDSTRPEDIGGANTRVLQKPVLPGELRAVLRDALVQAQPPAPGQAVVADFEGVDDILAFLRDTYRERLDARLAELESSIAQARERGLSGEETYRVLLLAHDLHGSAGSFGFFEVSAAVGRIELLFEKLLSGDIQDYEDFWAQLDEALLRATSGSVRPMSDYGEPSGASMGSVMVVDQDEAFIRQVTEMGKRRLIKVIGATQASEALSRARDHELDGVFIQVNLGEPHGGFRLARRLRDIEFGGVPVAFLDDADDLPTRVAAAHAGGLLFLPKPLAEGDFIGATRRFASLAAGEPIRVLVLHEDPQVADQLLPLMETDGVDLRAAQDPRALLEMLEAFRPDLLVAEVTLPHLSGFDACRMLRLHPKWQDLPVILRSNGNSAEMRAAAYGAGADDFIGAEIRGQELLDRTLNPTRRYRLVRERRDRDPLTGLMTRGVFAELVAGRISESSRVDRAVTVALLDVDRFRQLNDAHGVMAGDEVLSTLGKLLSARFRIEDLRARWGGSEFAVALSGANAPDAERVLRRLQEEFALLSFTTVSKVEFNASLSIGMATYPDHGDSAEELIARADEALRSARTQGVGGLHGPGQS